MKRISTLLMTTILIASGTASADNLATIIADCDGCHGDDGVSRWNDVPTIAGIDEFAHSEALFVYRDEARPCAESEYRQGDTSRAPKTMCAVVMDMSDEFIEEIAAYYAALPFVAAGQEFNAELAAAGEAIHARACDRCHSDGGSNPEDAASILAGQWMGYLATTFVDYAAGERDQPAKMQEALDGLSDEEVDALLNYYASQQ